MEYASLHACGISFSDTIGFLTNEYFVKITAKGATIRTSEGWQEDFKNKYFTSANIENKYFTARFLHMCH